VSSSHQQWHPGQDGLLAAVRPDGAATPHASRVHVSRDGELQCLRRQVQGRRNNGKPHYRWTFLSQYAAKNRVSHPTSVYLREEQLLLTSSYGLNGFALNLVYAHLFPHFILPRTAQARCGTTATARSSSAPHSALKTPRQQPAVVVLRA
jgi:hypothetical protein